MGGLDDAADAFRGDEFDGAFEADVQCRVHDAGLKPGVVEAEHEEGVVDWCVGAACDEAGVAVEFDTGLLDGEFGLRGGDYCVYKAVECGADRGAGCIEGGEAVLRADLADL